MGQLLSEDKFKTCNYCGGWAVHMKHCSRPKATFKPAMFPNNAGPNQVVKPLERKITVSLPVDESASISIELVDKRHIVVRRWSNRTGMRSINLHYNCSDKAEEYLDGVISYAKRVGAEVVHEAKHAFSFIGLAGKFVVDSPDFGKIAL